MTTLYVLEDHAFVGKQGGTLTVRQPDASIKKLPLARITQVVCCGDVSWSGAALRELAAEGIGVAYVGPYGEWVGRWDPAESKHVLLRRAQFRAADDPKQTLAIARRIIEGKLRNSRALLMRARRESMIVDHGEIEALTALIHRVEHTDQIDLIRGIEGEGSAIYFSAWGRLVSRHGFAYRGRQRRPPPDPINSLLSFGYSLLTHAAGTAVRIVGFDAHVGFLHSERYGRESLALDIVEEFRAPIVDALVAALINRRVLKPDDFNQAPTSCLLKPAARRRFIEQYEMKLDSELVHPVLGTRVTYRRCLELQARVLAKCLIGELPGYVPFCKR